MHMDFIPSLSLPAWAIVPPVVLIIFYIRSTTIWNSRSRGLPLPPGPRPLPFLGNILDFPRSRQGAIFREMCAKFGDMVHFDLLGQHVLVLGGPDVILELLNKRSANTSDRCVTPIVTLTGAGAIFSLQAYGEGWRHEKRGFWQYFRPGALSTYEPVQRKHAHDFLFQLLASPSQLKEHIRFTFSGVIWEVLFGESIDDEKMVMVKEGLEWVGAALVPGGKYLIEALPFLRFVPTWFPGATVQGLIAQWRASILRLKQEPYRRVKAAIVANDAPEGIVSRMIAKMIQQEDELLETRAEDVIQNIATTAIEGATDTVFSIMQGFFVAMVLNPEVQRKAQAELDAVVGSDRLPAFGDRKSLVYLNAVITETLRWQLALPYTIPHATLEDDEYRGYFIPAGTVILPVISNCTRNPKLYQDPDVFRPERFIFNGKLDFTTAPDPGTFMFGFGRRICTGRYFAENGLFIYIASILHVFNITRPEDEAGTPIAIREGTTDGLVSYPVDCRCTIRPRSPKAEALIREAHSPTPVE